MKVEIYGIPEEVHRCPACVSARHLLDSLGIEYTFYSVINKSQNSLGFDYDRERITECAKRIGCFPNLMLRYPVIFIDNKKVHHLKQHLEDLGYDTDL